MTTCRYYIKNTNNSRICKKNALPKNTFNEQGVDGLHMCNHHFLMVQKQIVSTIGRGVDRRRPFDFNQIIAQWDEYQLTQMNSLLQFRKEEFYQALRLVYDDVDGSVPLRAGTCGGKLVGKREHVMEDTADEILKDEWQNILVAFQMLEEDAKRDEHKESIPDVSEQQKECPICLEQFSAKNMSFLECAHALCNGCLRKLERRNVSQQCPVCRHKF